MLLLDKVTEGTIIRPTAFKPTEKGKNWPALISPEGSVASPSHPQPRNSVARFSVSTNDSDSGRNSATSMLVGASNGSSFSCSGSEGYESARVSSSTNHSTSVAEADHVLSSPKGVTDDVTPPEGEPYDLMLRHNYNDIEKPLQKVVEETSETREFEINELKQVYSKQL
uniref:Uncharacterized protein n=1 Tax=Ciona savignyi TaxID=51511 RepID=H2ZMH4_CIOSA